MRRWNVLAAGLIAATLIVLGVAPSTRDTLRFDARVAAGERPFAQVLLNLGVRREGIPGSRFTPPPPTVRPEPKAAPSTEFAVQLASATRLPGPEKWALLQQLGREFPNEPAIHAALARFACKNGGSVGVGRQDEVETVMPARPNQPAYRSRVEAKPEDIAILLDAAAAGERLDPENGYFPAMATVGFYAAHRDKDAHAALHRATLKPHWNEYFTTEAEGALQRAALLHGSQPTVSEVAYLSALLFPHYAQLRQMARLTAAHAVAAEQAGDGKAGLTLRKDLWTLGAQMRQRCSSVIGSLVGIAITRTAALRPGGTPSFAQAGIGSEQNERELRTRTDSAFVAYLDSHGAPGDGKRWLAESAAQQATRDIITRGQVYSAFSAPAIFGTSLQLLANVTLFVAMALISLLGGMAFLTPLLARRGRIALTVAFVVLHLWVAWCVMGQLGDLMCFHGLIQSLAGESITLDPARQVLWAQGTMISIALLTLVFACEVLPWIARAKRLPTTQLQRRWLLPIAAVLALLYAGHTLVFVAHERQQRAELRAMMNHEGRYMAGKLGQTWP